MIITYHSKKEEAEHVVSEIQSKGQNAACLQFDASDISSFDSFAEQLKSVLNANFGTEKLDYLVNNAGIGLPIPSFEGTTESQFDQLMNIHYKGVFFLTQKLLPLLNDNGGIVNTTTGLTRFTVQGSAAYAGMKAAVETLTVYLAKELGGRGIKVNAVAPGAVATDFSGGRLRDTPQAQEWTKSVTALKRVAQPDDIGGVIAFLCTEDAKWVTGQRIEVSGGMFI
ncbi:MAG: SDR family oxidoreductase [Paludibacteraceae bacterium]